ncbi:hypothetical protein SRHO_G00020060 [Serrasalmus rhombeus]
MKRHLLIILIITSGVFGADQIEPSRDQETDVFRKEGEPITLTCSYETSSEEVALFWYRQYPNRALQYLLLRGARTNSGERHNADHRFESSAARSSTELSLSEVRLTDTALFYCALLVIPQ